MQFTPTERRGPWYKGRDVVEVLIEDSECQFAWRLVVNGTMSPVCRDNEAILQYRGWCLTTDYWADTFPVFTPWRVVRVTE